MQKSRIIGYIRVSTDQQADLGNSLKAQETKIRQYCELFDLELVRIEVDAGASAGSLDRPALRRALQALDEFQAQGLLITKLDRLTRSVKDLCVLLETYFSEGSSAAPGANRLISVSEHVDTHTASGRLVLKILTVVSEWEREAIGERTAAVMQHMKATGQYTGGQAPYGMRKEGDTLVACPVEQALVALARDLHAKGGSLRSVARDLGNNPRTGKPFQPTQIVRMIGGAV